MTIGDYGATIFYICLFTQLFLIFWEQEKRMKESEWRKEGEIGGRTMRWRLHGKGDEKKQDERNATQRKGEKKPTIKDNTIWLVTLFHGRVPRVPQSRFCSPNLKARTLFFTAGMRKWYFHEPIVQSCLLRRIAHEPVVQSWTDFRKPRFL